MYTCRCRPLQRSQISESCTVTSRRPVLQRHARPSRPQKMQRRARAVARAALWSGHDSMSSMKGLVAGLPSFGGRKSLRAARCRRCEEACMCTISNPRALSQRGCCNAECHLRASQEPLLFQPRKAAEKARFDGCVDGEGNSSSLFVPVASRP